MKLKNVSLAVAGVVVALLAFSRSGRADTVEFVNGDRISGTLTMTAPGTLTLETAYAGALTIDPTAVASFVSDAPRTVRLSDGSIVTGVISGHAEGFAIAAPEGSARVTWAEVTAIAADVSALADAADPSDQSDQSDLSEAAVEAAPKLWSGTLDSGLTLRRGNTNTLDFTLSGTAKREGENNILTLKLLGAYGEAEDLRTTQKYQGEAKLQIYPEERWYYYLLGGAEHDEGRKLELRLNAAVGVGRDFIKKERLTLSADLGVDIARERWRAYTPLEEETVIDAARGASREGLQALAEGLSNGDVALTLETFRQAVDYATVLKDPLGGEGERVEEFVSLRASVNYQQQVFEASSITDALTLFANVEEFGEYRVTNDLGFTTPLTEALNLKISLRTEYDSLAEESGVDPWDNTLITGLSYKF